MKKLQQDIFYYSTLLAGAWLLGLAGESIYAPAMPEIAKQLNVSETFVKLTISYFILGKTLSMFFCSPVAEVFGRRQYILFGLGLFIIGGLICGFTWNIDLLLAGRLIQGLGCSITILMGRAIINDCFQGGYAAKVFSYIFTGNAIGIFIFPVLGGYMATYLGWRWIFLILSIYGLFILIIMWRFLPQTNPATNLSSLKPSSIWTNYKILFKNKILWGFLLSVAFMMAGEKAYSTSASFLFINKLGLSSIQYGYLTTGIWAAHLCGTALAGWIGLRAGIDRITLIGVLLLTCPSLLLLSLSLGNVLVPSVFVIAMLIYMFGTGFIIVSSAVGIVRPFPNLVGFATAFAMAFEFGISFGSSFIISHHPSSLKNIAEMVGTMGLLAFLSWLIFLFKSKRSQNQCIL